MSTSIWTLGGTSSGSWKRELVALGTNTDPYQWVESRYRFMPEILAALEEAKPRSRWAA